MRGNTEEVRENYDYDRSSTAETFRDDIEHASEPTSDSIHHRINTYFTKPVSISTTMANDSLLKRLLSPEEDRSMAECRILANRALGTLGAPEVRDMVWWFLSEKK